MSSQPKTIPRKTKKINAQGKCLGRLASQIANFLQGKDKVTYLPYLDRGDFVEVVNIHELKFTGKKLKNKLYYHHSGYPGGLSKRSLEELFVKNPAELLRHTVQRMLPKNKLKKAMIKRLRIKK